MSKDQCQLVESDRCAFKAMLDALDDSYCLSSLC